MPLRYTELEEGEHLIDILNSDHKGNGIETKTLFKIRKNGKVDDLTLILRRDKGRIFITNKRFIFESLKEEKASQNHSFFHEDIEITYGRNGRYLPPGPGVFELYPINEIDWDSDSDVDVEGLGALFGPPDSIKSTKPKTPQTWKGEAGKGPFGQTSLIDGHTAGYRYIFGYGGDLSKKLNTEFYSNQEKKVKLYELNKEERRIEREERRIEREIAKAKHHEKLLEFEDAELIYKALKMEDELIRIRKLKSEQGAVKVSQKVVHGDEVTKTEIKDSVLNRSNVGAGGKSKSEELREAKALLDDGIIDDAEFKQMKKEILGK